MTPEPTADLPVTWRQAADLRVAIHRAVNETNDGALLARWDELDAALVALMRALPHPLRDFG